MKNLIRLSVVLLMVGYSSISILAQQKISDKMFNEFRSMDEVTYLSFSKNLIDIINFEIDEDDDEEDDHQVSGDLHEVKLVVYKPDFKPEKNFRDQVLKFLDKGNYKLVETEDDDDDTEVWVHRKGKKVYECHVIFQGDKNGVLLSFIGDFRIDDVDAFKNKMEDYKD
ncbi:DUF4252 domain-containing protein [Labilibacter sediminis]|nr:DUF4252 domain-containing protein [Labilibacter sediminis]